MNTFSAALIVILLIWSGTLPANDGVSIHGYLSQEYAQSYGYQIFGITERGKSDYRNLTLQFRYDSESTNSFVIQLSHLRQDSSSIMAQESDVLLDWAFLEHGFSSMLSAKFGKIQVPFGIYNKIGDVGTLLPVYHLPYVPYGGGTYTNATLNGAAMSANYTLPGDWEVLWELYGGEWDWKRIVILQNPISGSEIQITDAPKIKQTVGGCVAVTPAGANLSLGVSGYTAVGEGGWSCSNGTGLGKERLSVMNLLVSTDIYPFYLKSEYTRYFFKKHKSDGTGFYARLAGISAPFFNCMRNTRHITLMICPYPGWESAPWILTITTHRHRPHHPPGCRACLAGRVSLEQRFCVGRILRDYAPDNRPKKQYLILSVTTSFESGKRNVT